MTGVDLSYKGRLEIKKTKRSLMMSNNLRSILSELLLGGKIKNLTIINHSIILSEVAVASNLKTAKIFLRLPLVDKNDRTTQKQVITALNEERYNIKKLLRYKIVSKNIPDLEFFYDEKFDYVEHMNNLLDSLN